MLNDNPLSYLYSKAQGQSIKYIRFVLPNKKLAYQGFLFSLNFSEHKYKCTKQCTKTGFTQIIYKLCLYKNVQVKNYLITRLSISTPNIFSSSYKCSSYT